MVPYASLDEDTVIDKENGIEFNFTEAITQIQYLEMKQQINSTLGDRAEVPDVTFTNAQKNGLYTSMMLIACFITLVFASNIIILFQYMWEASKRERMTSLMIYNLIEYTVTNLMDSIYDEIRINNLSYVAVNEYIRVIWRKTILKSTNDSNANYNTFLRKN